MPGRSILANVIGIEEAATEYAMTEGDPATFLFDFSEAFPSVHQEFLLAALQHIGMPPNAIAVVRALYDNCRCILCFAGDRWPGFERKVCIRQGRPLSALLFAVVIDLFLRQLKKAGIKATIRAYPDDFAIVVRSVSASLPIIRTPYMDLATISNLNLNLPKTICIPLWATSIPIAKATIVAICPGWSQNEVSSTGKYLGFYVGPGKADKAWQAASHKMLYVTDSNVGLVYFGALLRYHRLQHLHFIFSMLRRLAGTLPNRLRHH